MSQDRDQGDWPKVGAERAWAKPTNEQREHAFRVLQLWENIIGDVIEARDMISRPADFIGREDAPFWVESEAAARQIGTHLHEAYLLSLSELDLEDVKSVRDRALVILRRRRHTELAKLVRSAFVLMRERECSFRELDSELQREIAWLMLPMPAPSLFHQYESELLAKAVDTFDVQDVRLRFKQEGPAKAASLTASLLLEVAERTVDRDLSARRKRLQLKKDRDD